MKKRNSIKKTILGLALLSFSYQSLAVSAYEQGREGGDVLFCEASGSKYPTSGYYFIDYVMSQNPVSQFISVSDELKSTEKIFKKLATTLNKLKPGAVGSIHSFVGNYKESVLNGDETVWFPSSARKTELLDVKDEFLIQSRVPKNCWSGGAKVELVQSVIYLSGSRQFFYDAGIDQDQRNMGRIGQLQILMRNLHEIGRVLLGNDSIQIQKIVEYLASTSFQSDSFESVQNKLFEIGLTSQSKTPFVSESNIMLADIINRYPNLNLPKSVKNEIRGELKKYKAMQARFYTLKRDAELRVRAFGDRYFAGNTDYFYIPTSATEEVHNPLAWLAKFEPVSGYNFVKGACELIFEARKRGEVLSNFADALQAAVGYNDKQGLYFFADQIKEETEYNFILDFDCAHLDLDSSENRAERQKVIQAGGYVQYLQSRSKSSSNTKKSK